MRISTIINTSLDGVWESSQLLEISRTSPFCRQPRVSLARCGSTRRSALPEWLGVPPSFHSLDRPNRLRTRHRRHRRRNLHVSWHLHPLDDEHTRLTIEVWPRPVSRIPGLRQFLRIIIVGPLMRKYLKSVTAGVNWFVTSGKPVKEDQFGSHIWFSAKKRRR